MSERGVRDPGRVIVVGSANIDLIAQVEHLPGPGETVIGSQVAVRPGGKGANQAVAACRLGAPTTMFAAVGTDSFGDQVLESLTAEGVQDRVTRVPEVATGIATVTVSALGENSIVVAAGGQRPAGRGCPGRAGGPVRTRRRAGAAARDPGADVCGRRPDRPSPRRPGAAQRRPDRPSPATRPSSTCCSRWTC